MNVQSDIILAVATVLIFLGNVLAEYENTEIIFKPIDRKPLTCYRCYEYEEHCQSLANLTNIEVRQCQPDEIYCKVQRLENREVMQSFERSCSKFCTPGCRTMIYRTLCVSCCDGDMCNTDSAASGTSGPGIVAVHAVLAAFMLRRD